METELNLKQQNTAWLRHCKYFTVEDIVEYFEFQFSLMHNKRVNLTITQLPFFSLRVTSKQLLK